MQAENAGPIPGAIGIGHLREFEQVGAGGQSLELLKRCILSSRDGAVPLRLVSLGKIAAQRQAIFAVVRECIRGSAELCIAAAEAYGSVLGPEPTGQVARLVLLELVSA